MRDAAGMLEVVAVCLVCGELAGAVYAPDDDYEDAGLAAGVRVAHQRSWPEHAVELRTEASEAAELRRAEEARAEREQRVVGAEADRVALRVGAELAVRQGTTRPMRLRRYA